MTEHKKFSLTTAITHTTKVADFCSAKYNISFEERDELLMDYGELRGGSAADVESQRDDYEAGKTPVEAYCDEWGDE